MHKISVCVNKFGDILTHKKIIVDTKLKKKLSRCKKTKKVLKSVWSFILFCDDLYNQHYI